ncbi:Ribosomal RNA large subunit methyltransferase N [Clostridiaceae bacterium JG1575]|nr:Ribosomal RNA large subunit methyltransferase N [Clostridiaceae bacterium JG1575]
MEEKNEQTLRPSLLDYTRAELGEWLAAHEDKASRAEVVWRYLYREGIQNPHRMTELREATRALLDESFQERRLTREAVREDDDATVKFLFRLPDGHLIETVLMKHPYGRSVCLTSQIGCNMGCRFCASGQLFRERSLKAGELVAQWMEAARWLNENAPDESLTHMVLMGIGEPFDNYEEVVRFLRIVTDQKGLAIGPRHISVSTSGLVPGIRAFAREALPVKLAISLHAPNDALRSSLMAVNRRYPLKELMAAVTEYIDRSGQRVNFGYILISGINDDVKQAQELADLLRPLGRRAAVNLIPYNPVAGTSFERSNKEAIDAFYETLVQQGILCVRRKERGKNIDAACGQLRSRYLHNPAESPSHRP